jgi:hypothetical protein
VAGAPRGSEAMTIRKVTTAEIQAMLREAFAEYGYTLEDVKSLWDADRLDEPRLRDLMLIWGDALD